MTLAGIDVSAAGQGPNFPWPQYHGKIQFAGVKVSEGLGYADPYAATNIAGARAIGAAVMGYHFLHANSDGAMQANAFMSHAKAAKMERGDLMAVDVEQGGMDGLPSMNLWAVAVRFAEIIHDHFGAWPVLYTDISMAEGAPGFAPLGNCPLWLANPSRVHTGAIGPWSGPSFEQVSQRGVDTDVFYGDATALAKLAIPR